MSKIAVGIGASILLLGTGLAAAKDRTFNGEIMDSACAKEGSHEA
jgi:type 1 fimbria pilin